MSSGSGFEVPPREPLTRSGLASDYAKDRLTVSGFLPMSGGRALGLPGPPPTKVPPRELWCSSISPILASFSKGSTMGTFKHSPSWPPRKARSREGGSVLGGHLPRTRDGRHTKVSRFLSCGGEESKGGRPPVDSNPLHPASGGAMLQVRRLVNAHEAVPRTRQPCGFFVPSGPCRVRGGIQDLSREYARRLRAVTRHPAPIIGWASTLMEEVPPWQR